MSVVVQETRGYKIERLEIKEYDIHFSKFSNEAQKKSVLPIFKVNPDSSFIYRVNGETYHIIFAFENKVGKKLNKNSLPKKDKFDQNEDIKNIKPIKKEDRDKIRSDLERTSKVIMDCLYEAIKFSSWNMEKKFNGFTVDGHSANAYGMAFNGGVLGVKISIDKVNYLDDAIEFSQNWPNSSKAKEIADDAKLYIASLIVHELSHHQSESETLAYMREMIYAMSNNKGSLPIQTVKENNAIFTELIKSQKKLRKGADPSKVIHEDYRPRYFAIVIIASILAENNDSVREDLLKGKNLKTKTLAKIFSNSSRSIRAIDLEYLKGRYDEITSATNPEELINEEAKKAMDKFGIKSMVPLISKREGVFYATRR